MLVAGVAGGLWLWSGSGSGGAPAAGQDELPKNPDLAEMPFPDLEVFGLGDGSGLCEPVNEIMRGRGYQPVDAKGGDTEASCWYITTGLSLLEDGSNNLNADISVWRGDADSRYQTFLDKFAGQRDAQQEKPDFRLSKIEQFPVGDLGFISHQEYVSPGSERTDTTAFFRSGDDIVMIALWGYVQHVSESGEDLPNEPLTEEVTYREVTDILRAMNGSGEPGEGQITDPDLKENPALKGLTAPRLATEGTAEQACAPFTAVAEKLGTRSAGTNVNHAGGAPEFGCTFDPPERPEDLPDDYSEREINIRFVAYAEEEAFRASEKMGRELLGLRNQTATDKVKPSPLYELPVGDLGYALYHVPGYGYVTAGYLVDGRTYVHIEISGWSRGDGVEPLTEDVLMKDLATLLTEAGA